MKIIMAKSSGFCFGVKNAVSQASRLAQDPSAAGTVFMLGELIHNRSVIQELQQQGLTAAAGLEDVEPGAAVIIRTHGVAPAVIAALEEKGCRIIDCTCPFVTKIHRIVQQAWQQGKGVIIAGMAGHAEVEGINGSCGGAGVILDSELNAKKHEFSQREWILVAQTTFSLTEYQKIRNILEKKIAKLQIFDTICITTEDRQQEACAIAQQADLMLVIGSPGSSNTQKLLSICRSHCGWTHLVEDAAQIGAIVGERSLRDLTVGITAGASTPDEQIRGVIETVESLTGDE